MPSGSIVSRKGKTVRIDLHQFRLAEYLFFTTTFQIRQWSANAEDSNNLLGWL